MGDGLMIRAILKHLAPLPDLRKMKKAVFIGPHPDDIEIGAGGTIHRLIGEGAQITYVICTDGSSGFTDPNMTVEKLAVLRKDESLKAAEIMGVERVIHLDLPDAGPYDEWALACRLAGILADFRPEAVFCPDPELPSETHPDHLRVGRASKTAVFMANFASILNRNGIPCDSEKIAKTPSPALAYYFTHRPNRFIAYSREDRDAKTASILCHRSQFSEGSPEWRGLSAYLRLREAAFGWRIFRCRAEGFFVMAPLHQHAFPEVNRF
jgi:LmbE family N-acetylglucosaminyl deacetylase